MCHNVVCRIIEERSHLAEDRSSEGLKELCGKTNYRLSCIDD